MYIYIYIYIQYVCIHNASGERLNSLYCIYSRHLAAALDGIAYVSTDRDATRRVRP